MEGSTIARKTLDKDDADYNYTTTTTPMYFHMNWGWDGDSDGYFGVAPEEWDTSHYDAYQYNADILYNFELMED